MDAHCRCPPAATSLRVILFPLENTYHITVEILTFRCSYFSFHRVCNSYPEFIAISEIGLS